MEKQQDHCGVFQGQSSSTSQQNQSVAKLIIHRAELLEYCFYLCNKKKPQKFKSELVSTSFLRIPVCQVGGTYTTPDVGNTSYTLETKKLLFKDHIFCAPTLVSSSSPRNSLP